MGASLILARIAILATAAVPLIVVPGYFFPFVTPRNVFFRACVSIALFFVVLASPRWTRATLRSDRVLIWFGVYVAAIAVSAAFGASPWRSFFGDFERMVLRSTMTERWWRILFGLTLLAADLTILIGAAALARVGVNEGFATTMLHGSTLGNSGLFASCLLVAAAIACVLLIGRGSRTRVFAGISLPLLLAGIGFSANRSSEIGLVVGTLIGAGVLLALRPDKRRLLRGYAVISLAIIASVLAGDLALRARAPYAANQLVSKWDILRKAPLEPIRLIEWRTAVRGFAAHPILGYGPENYRVVESAQFDPGIYRLTPEIVFDRAHNAWLELLATTGVVGTIAMLGIWLAAFAMIRRGILKEKLTAAEAAVIVGSLCAYAVYLTFWFFDLSSTMLWVALLAYLSGKVQVGAAEAETSPMKASRRWPIAAVAGGAIAIAFYVESFIPLQTARDLNRAIQTDENVDEHFTAFYRVMTSTAPQTFHTPQLFNQYLSNFADVMPTARQNPSLAGRLRYAFERGYEEDSRNVARDPFDDRAYLERARLLVYAGGFYADASKYSAAARNMKIAIQLSPRRTYNRIFLSDIHLLLGDSAAARAQLDTARLIAPDYLLLKSRLANLGMTP